MTYSNRHFGNVEEIGKYDSQEPLLSILNIGMSSIVLEYKIRWGALGLTLLAKIFDLYD